MVRKRLVGLVAILVIPFLSAGCSNFSLLYKMSRNPSLWTEYYDMVYEVRVLSDEARDVTLYLPIPHYRGKPVKKIVKWLKEYNDRYFKEMKSSDEKDYYRPIVKVFSKITMDLVDTDYGTMLKIYIPKLLEKEHTSEIRFCIEKPKKGGRNVSVNKETVRDDYRLTYEDKLKAVDERMAPRSDDIERKLEMPVYVQFKGERLQVRLKFFIFKSFRFHAAGFSYFDYWLGNSRPEDEWEKESEEKSVLTKSGWHWLPVVKYTDTP